MSLLVLVMVAVVDLATGCTEVVLLEVEVEAVVRMKFAGLMCARIVIEVLRTVRYAVFHVKDN
jgi:hypothetical protein